MMIVKQSLLLPWTSLPLKISSTICKVVICKASTETSTTTTSNQLTARERRQLRNERRESTKGYNWKQEVEEKLIKKPKKVYAPKSAQLNLDNLALLGIQWWIVRVSRLRGEETANLIAKQLIRNFPHMEFKVYAPAIQVKRKLKNGTISIKPKPIFPGCVFLQCVMNREVHDFLREVEGVSGFVGAKVGTNKRQINKPRPVSDDDMEVVFREAKEEQEKYEQSLMEELKEEEKSFNPDKVIINTQSEADNITVSMIEEAKPKARSRKKASVPQKNDKIFAPGSTVRVVSGNFVDFVGILKKVSRKTKMATVGFTLFGKESLVELSLDEIVAETK
ncbi:hypothetical protein ACFE04_020117 [Oxalis oulophora]